MFTCGNAVRALWLGLQVVAWAGGVAADESAPADSTIQRIIRQRVDAKRSTGIVVGVLDRGGNRIVAYGPAGASGGAALDGDSEFEIGSITKVFTSSVLSDMVARGEVRLEDPISKYLPKSVKTPAKDGKPITLMHLSTQTSGLPRLPSNLNPKNPANPYADYSVQQMYEFLSSYQLPRGPGDKYEYSNLGVGLLGHILALRAGMSYEEVVKARILVPLGMHDTAITLSAAQQARFATGHAGTSPVPHWDLPVLAGAGALRSTARDMLKFLAANLDTSTASLPTALRQTHRVRHGTDDSDVDIGLGWHILHRYGRDFVWHNGATAGFSTYMGFDAKQHVGVVVLSNSNSSIDDLAMHLLDSRFPLTPAPRDHKEIAIDPKILDAYVGRYQLAPTFSIAVTREGNGLFIQATGQEKFPAFPESETNFFLKVVDAQVSFEKDATGKVTQLVLHQNGRDLPGRRVE